MDVAEQLAATKKYYQQNAEIFHDTGITHWQHELDDFHAHLPAGKVLEIGSASGVEAKILCKWYDYVGIDYSEKFCEMARAELPNERFECVDLFNMAECLDMKFDGFWCVATLLHVPKSRMVEALETIAGVLSDDAIGFIAIKEGEGEEYLVEKGQTYGRFYSYWQKNELLPLMRKAGFEVFDSSSKGKSERVDNRVQRRWLTFFVHKQGVRG